MVQYEWFMMKLDISLSQSNLFWKSVKLIYVKSNSFFIVFSFFYWNHCLFIWSILL